MKALTAEQQINILVALRSKIQEYKAYQNDETLRDYWQGRIDEFEATYEAIINLPIGAIEMTPIY